MVWSLQIEDLRYELGRLDMSRMSPGRPVVTLDNALDILLRVGQHEKVMCASKNQSSPSLTRAKFSSCGASEKHCPVGFIPHLSQGIRHAHSGSGSAGSAVWGRIAGCVFLISVGGLVATALGQTNVEVDPVQRSQLHDLSPVAGLLWKMLLLFGGIILAVAAVLTALRYRTSTNLYKVATDEQWKEDAWDEAGVIVEEGEISEACENLEHPASAAEADQPAAAEPPGISHERLFTPASGPAWGEPMVNAFLSACLKANSLGRVWRENAASRNRAPPVARGSPDPCEAELIRKFKARWHEFHVDPDNGIFIDRGAGQARTRVCLIGVTREKRAVTEAVLNSGFVIDSLDKYLRSSVKVSPSGIGKYHAVTRTEFEALPAEEQRRALPLKQIPDPWQSMIAGAERPKIHPEPQKHAKNPARQRCNQSVDESNGLMT
jgi:hypothetical protein